MCAPNVKLRPDTIMNWDAIEIECREFHGETTGTDGNDWELYVVYYKPIGDETFDQMKEEAIRYLPFASEENINWVPSRDKTGTLFYAY